MAHDQKTSAHGSHGEWMTVQNMNPRVVAAQYAVRGELLLKAEEYAQDLKSGKKLRFTKTIACNIGNPQAQAQKPITFFRQVTALCAYPELLHAAEANRLFPDDVRARAQAYIHANHSMGAYSGSQGIDLVRQEVARFIEKRDGYPSDPKDIFLTAGASEGVKMLLQCAVATDRVGVMIPSPQYPLYSGTLAVLGGRRVDYLLNEEAQWGISAKDLEASYDHAVSQGTDVRVLVVVNPGNPTGQCLEASVIEDIIRFAHKRKLILFADEVYQTNIYGKVPFVSFKKVLLGMPVEFKDQQLVSFHSASKGFTGECGFRGGYFELTGFAPEVHQQVYKLAAIGLCPTVPGQIMIGLMVNPPAPGDPSYDLYAKESKAIIESLKRRAQMLAAAFNRMENITCNTVDGALYAFPQIHLPRKAIAAAQELKQSPDTFYCFALLEATGLIVVPGSGFGQKAGTYHFRTTILPPEDVFAEVVDKYEHFNKEFMAQYRD